MAGREPWAYGFLEKYAPLAGRLGMAACALGLVWLLVAGLGMLLYGGRGEGYDILLAIVSVVAGVAVLGLVLLAIFLQVAVVLLAVDAARNLRAILRQLSKR